VQHDDLAARLLAALERGDDLALATILSPDCSLFVDADDPTAEGVRGRARVTHALRTRLTTHPDASLRTVHVNGGPGLALRRGDGVIIGVLVLGVGDDDSVVELWLSTAPEKLAHWNRRRPETN
jgi:ketosteroid isomerase-like protein